MQDDAKPRSANVTTEEAIQFLECALRNCPHVSFDKSDLEDVRLELERFAGKRTPAPAQPAPPEIAALIYSSMDKDFDRRAALAAMPVGDGVGSIEECAMFNTGVIYNALAAALRTKGFEQLELTVRKDGGYDAVQRLAATPPADADAGLVERVARETRHLSPASPPRDRWLTKEEARTLVDAAKSPHIKLFLVLGLSTGARAGAILDLTWDRVDFTHGTIDYRPAGRIQTNKRRTVVPMNATAREALEEAYRGRLTDHVIEYSGKPVASVKKAVERLAKDAGIAVSPHVLRHTCAVWMAQADVPMQKISQYLGHTSLNMTVSVYARYSPSFMADAGAAAEF